MANPRLYVCKFILLLLPRVSDSLRSVANDTSEEEKWITENKDTQLRHEPRWLYVIVKCIWITKVKIFDEVKSQLRIALEYSWDCERCS